MPFLHTVPVSAGTSRPSDDWVDTVGQPGTELQRHGPCGFRSTLSPSLLSDLRRFAEGPAASDLLPVLAASVRHAQSLALHLVHADGVIKLSVFPRDQLFHCFTDICALSARAMTQLQLVYVEPEISLDPSHDLALPTTARRFGALRELLWSLAMHGPHSELLPEIGGPVRYRLSPVFSIGKLPVEQSMQVVMQRMRNEPASLDQLAGWSILGRFRVKRLLNALYLQSGLVISRSPTLWRPTGSTKTHVVS
jgi:hypothetical protein